MRFLDVERSSKILGIELIEGKYDYEGWLNSVRGLEDEPEKGERCKVCFDNRLSETLKLAKKLGENRFTTTLLISPLKSQNRLLEIGKRLQQESGVEFIFRDYRSNGGVEKQGRAVKENLLYRQDYCGCIFALKDQRESQDKFMDEMISPINRQVLPASIEEKIDFYRNISKKSKIVKENFLNYRLLKGKVSIKKEVIPSYFLFYSHSKREKISGRIEYVSDEVGYLNREGVKIISLEKLNYFANSSFKTVSEIDLEVSQEVKIRNSIEKTLFSLSIIIVLDKIPTEKIDVEIKSKIYFDQKIVSINC